MFGWKTASGALISSTRGDARVDPGALFTASVGGRTFAVLDAGVHQALTVLDGCVLHDVVLDGQGFEFGDFVDNSSQTTGPGTGMQCGQLPGASAPALIAIRVDQKTNQRPTSVTRTHIVLTGDTAALTDVTTTPYQGDADPNAQMARHIACGPRDARTDGLNGPNQH